MSANVNERLGGQFEVRRHLTFGTELLRHQPMGGDFGTKDVEIVGCILVWPSPTTIPVRDDVLAHAPRESTPHSLARDFRGPGLLA